MENNNCLSKNTTSWKRLLSFILVFSLVVGILPSGALKPLEAYGASNTKTKTKAGSTRAGGATEIPSDAIKKDISQGKIIIPAGNQTYHITGSTTNVNNYIAVQPNYNGTIYFDNVNIDYTNQGNGICSPVSIHGAQDGNNNNPITKVDLVLKGSNRLVYPVGTTNGNSFPALHVGMGSQVNLAAIDPEDNNSGTLFASKQKSTPDYKIGQTAAIGSGGNSKPWPADIGSPYMNTSRESYGEGHNLGGGNIVISSGNVTALGSRCAAGIGGGYSQFFAGNILIVGGKILSKGGIHGAGIGTGCPNSNGNDGSKYSGSSIIALPPADITATTEQAGKPGLAGAGTVVYVGDPTTPQIYIQTEDKLPNADVYFDLSENSKVSGIINGLYPSHEITKIKVGTTASNGNLITRGNFSDGVTIFTDASNNDGKPYLPYTEKISGGKPANNPVKLKLFNYNVKFTDIPSSPLKIGYTAAEAKSSGPGVKIEWNDATQMSDVTFALQLESGEEANFEDLQFFGADGTTPIAAPTMLKNGDVYTVRAKLKDGKDAEIYSNILQIKGKMNISGKSTNITLRRMFTQNVTMDDTGTYHYIKVTSNKANQTVKKVSDFSATLTMLIDHDKVVSGQGEKPKYNKDNVKAFYLISKDKNYESANTNAAAGDWKPMNVAANNNTSVSTNVNFSGLTDGTYYIHWKVTSGVISAHSQNHGTAPVAQGAYGPFILDGKDLEVELKANNNTTAQTITTLNKISLKIKFNKPVKETLTANDFTITKALGGNGKITNVQKVSNSEYTADFEPDSSWQNKGTVEISVTANKFNDHIDNKNKASNKIKFTLSGTDIDNKKPTATITANALYTDLKPTGIKITLTSGDKAFNQNTDLSLAQTFAKIADNTDVTGQISIKQGSTPVSGFKAVYKKVGENGIIDITFTSDLTSLKEYTITVENNKFYNLLGNGNTVVSKKFTVNKPVIESGDAGLVANPKIIAHDAGTTDIIIQGKGFKALADANLLEVRVVCPAISYESPWTKNFTTGNPADKATIKVSGIPTNNGTSPVDYKFALEMKINGTVVTTPVREATVTVDVAKSKQLVVTTKTTSVPDLQYGYTAAQTTANNQIITIKNNSKRDITLSSLVVDGGADGMVIFNNQTPTNVIQSGQSLDITVTLKNGPSIYPKEYKTQKVTITGKLNGTTETTTGDTTLVKQVVVKSTTPPPLANNKFAITTIPAPNSNWTNSAKIIIDMKNNDPANTVTNWKYQVTESSSFPTGGTWVSKDNPSASDFGKGEFNTATNKDMTYYVHWVVDTQTHIGITGSVEANGTKEIKIDRVVPTLTKVESSVTTVGALPVTITVTASEDVASFDQTKFTVTGGSATYTKSGKTVVVTVTPAAGDVKVVVGAGAITDKAGNQNTDTKSITVTKAADTTKPTVVMKNKAIYNTLTPSFTIELTSNDYAVNNSANNKLFNSNTATAVITNADIRDRLVIKDADGTVVPKANYSIAYTEATGSAQGKGIATITFSSDLANDKEYIITMEADKVFNKLGLGNAKAESKFIVAKIDLESNANVGLFVTPKTMGSNGGTAKILVKGTAIKNQMLKDQLTLNVVMVSPNGSQTTIPVPKTATFGTDGGYDTVFVNHTIPKNEESETVEYKFKLEYTIEGSKKTPSKEETIKVSPSADKILVVKVENTTIGDLTHGYTSAQSAALKQKVTITNKSAEPLTNLAVTLENGTEFTLTTPGGNTIPAGDSITTYLQLKDSLDAGTYGGNTKVKATGTVDGKPVTGTGSIKVQKVNAVNKPSNPTGYGTVTANPNPTGTSVWKNYAEVKLTAKALNYQGTGNKVTKLQYAVTTSSNASGASWKIANLASDGTCKVSFPADANNTYYIHYILDTKNATGLSGTIAQGAAKEYQIDRVAPAITSVDFPANIGSGKFTATIVFNEKLEGPLDDSKITIEGGIKGTVSLDSTGKKVLVEVTPANNANSLKVKVAEGLSVDRANNKTKSGESKSATVDRTSPTATIEVNTKEVYLEELPSFQVKIKDNGKANHNLYQADGITPIGPVCVNDIVKVTLSDGTPVAITAAYDGNGVYTITPSIGAAFPEGDYHVHINKDSVLNCEGNKIKESDADFKIHPVKFDTAKSIDASPNPVAYKGETVTVTIKGENLQHIKGSKGKLTVKLPAGVDKAGQKVDVTAAANGKTATYKVKIPTNTTNAEKTYTFEGFYTKPGGGEVSVGTVDVKIKPATPGLSKFDLNETVVTYEGGNLTATVKGDNLHNFNSLQIEIDRSKGGAAEIKPLKPATKAGEQTMTMKLSFEENTTAVTREEKVELTYVDEHGAKQVYKTITVKIEPSVPKINKFYGSHGETKESNKITVKNKGGKVDFEVKGTNLHNFTPILLKDEKTGKTVSVALSDKNKLGKASITFVENKSPDDEDHTITVHYVDQGNSNSKEVYSTKVVVTVKGSYPAADTLTMKPEKHSAKGGKSTATIKGIYLDNLVDFELRHDKGGVFPIAKKDISKDEDRTSATITVELPKWLEGDRNDIYDFEVYVKGKATGVKAKVEVGDSLPNVKGIKADPAIYKSVQEAKGKKSTITIHGNYLFNFKKIEIYDRTFEDFYPVTNAKDETASCQVKVPSANGTYTYDLYIDGEKTDWNVSIGVGDGVSLGESGEVKPSDPADDKVVDEGPSKKPKDKEWRGTGGGNKGRGSAQYGSYKGFDILEYQSKQEGKKNPANPIVVLHNTFYMPRGQFDQAASGAKEAARKSEKRGEGNLMIIFDTTMEDDETKLEGRLYVDLTNPVPDLFTGVFVSDIDTRFTKQLFKDTFKVEKVAVVSLGQNDPFGVTKFEVAANVDLTAFGSKEKGFDPSKLYFTVLNRQTGDYKPLENPEAYMDEAGYLHFMTKDGGDIIITEKPISPATGTFAFDKADKKESK